MQVRTSNSPVTAYLDRLIERYASDASGAVADYIPELAAAEPDLFGISVATVDGAVYASGDSNHRFTIQSISKPLTFALALEERGEEYVGERIGVEPTGDAFNSITLSPKTGTPLNPMVNAGAIAAVGLLDRELPTPPGERITGAYARWAGRPLEVDEAVRASESGSGDRNRAISHLLRSSSAIENDPHAVVEDYFTQCSTLVDCTDLAVIAATLANGGVNPLTGERAAHEHTVRNVLSVMLSCGMYDHAGDWLYTVGLPAKSGVAGGIIAVLPGELGIGVFSPRLDEAGNSARGVRVCEDMSQELELHSIQTAHRPPSPVRNAFDLAQMHSKRSRLEPQRLALERMGAAAGAFELQGELTFVQFEQVARAVLDAEVRFAVLDFERVSRIDDQAASMLVDLEIDLKLAGGTLVVSGTDEHAEVFAEYCSMVESFSELDIAMEWCEDQLLAGEEAEPEPERVPLEHHELLQGCTPEELVQLRLLMQTVTIPAGEEAFAGFEGPADEIMLVMRGRLSAYIELKPGKRRRYASVGPGAALGELAYVNRVPRMAVFVAETDVEAALVTRELINELASTDAALQAKLLGNMLGVIARHALDLRAATASLVD
ncbi:MAG: glutaminase A [Solirubrobacterales bacterium]